jgi:hypothetical protein
MHPVTKRAVRWRRVLAAVVVAVLVSVGVATGSSAASAAPGEIGGRVYLGSTARAAGAGDVVVSLLEYQGTTNVKVPYAYAGGVVSTDANGYYLFTGLPSSRFDVVFSYVGPEDFLQETRPYTSFFAPNTFNTTIPVAYSLRGHVDIDSSSHAAAAGQVRVSLRSSAGGTEYASALTDANGDFHIPSMPVRNYTVEFTVPGSTEYPTWYYVAGNPVGSRDYTKATSFALNSTVTGLTVVVGDGPVISGVVRDSAGNPMAGQIVSARAEEIDPYPGNYPLSDLYTATTGLDGAYVFRALPATRDYRIFVSSLEYAYAEPGGGTLYAQRAPVRIAGGVSQTAVDLVVYRVATVTGSLTGPALTQVGAGASWVLMSSYYDEVTSTWTPDAGHVNAAEPGGYATTAFGPGDYRFSILLQSPCILRADYSCTTSGPNEIVATTGVIRVVEGVDFVVNFPNLTLGSLAVGRLVRSTASGSPVYLVNGRKTLVRVDNMATATDAGISPSVTSVSPALLAPYNIKPAPLSNFVRCGYDTYVSSVGWLWRVDPAVVAGLPRTDVDVLACEPRVISDYGPVKALMLEGPNGDVYRIADGAKHLVSSRIGVQSFGYYHGFVLPVSAAFLNSLPTGAPVGPLVIPRPALPYAPFAAAAAVAASSAVSTPTDPRIACYAQFFGEVGVSLYGRAASEGMPQDALAECLAADSR